MENEKMHGSNIFSSSNKEDQNTSSNDIEHEQVVEYQ